MRENPPLRLRRDRRIFFADDLKLGNGNPRLGDANLKLRDANLKLENANLKLRNANLKLENANLKLGDANLKLENANLKLENANLKLGDANLKLGDANLKLGDANLKLGDANPRLWNGNPKLRNANLKLRNLGGEWSTRWNQTRCTSHPLHSNLYKALLCGSPSILSWTSLIIGRAYNHVAIPRRLHPEVFSRPRSFLLNTRGFCLQR